MSGFKVINGERLKVAFEGSPRGYAGIAGVVPDEGDTRLISFKGSARQFAGITSGVVDGETVKVVGIRNSREVASMVVVTVEPATPAE